MQPIVFCAFLFWDYVPTVLLVATLTNNSGNRGNRGERRKLRTDNQDRKIVPGNEMEDNYPFKGYDSIQQSDGRLQYDEELGKKRSGNMSSIDRVSIGNMPMPNTKSNSNARINYNR